MTPELTDKERARIKKDVVNHQIELKVVGGGEDITPEEIRELEESLDEASDDELCSWWDHVGEWVASRGFDPEEQFEKLKNTGDVDYGYMQFKYDQPY